MKIQSILTMLMGFMAGAGAMYVMDPRAGRRRRALARDKVIHLSKVTQRQTGRRVRDFRNRAYGMVAETRGAVVHTFKRAA